MENRITELESRHAFLENTVDELNQVVIKQQDQIDELTRRLQGLETEMAVFISRIRDKNDEAPPPHY